MSDDDTEDIDELLSQLNVREEENQQKCYRRSAVRIAQEIRRRAKAEQRLLPYMHACFRVMVNSSSLFDAAAGRDASIELIRLLESPDQARRIAPELNEAEYENAIHWMSSCAYDNLADNTAELFGYNSDGMHQCINDGIQVCRRTGKMQCISCFREYAAHVYCAADDIDMAIHFAKQSVNNPNPASEGRRWASSYTLTKMLLRSGNLRDATESIQRTWQLVSTYHSPLEGQHKTFELYSEIMALLGQEPNRSLAPAETPPADEYPHLHMLKDYAAAIVDLMQGDHSSAINRLSVWDAQLKSRQQIGNWFQTRLRILCAVRMSGDLKRLQTLSQELEPRAREARDWYTLRCLAQINDPDYPALPVPSLKPFNVGPLAPRKLSPSSEATAAPANMPNSDTQPDNQTLATDQAKTADSSPQSNDIPEDLAPLAMSIMTLAQQQQMGMTVDDQSVNNARQELLEHSCDASSDPQRVRWLLHLMTFLAPTSEHTKSVWQWSQKIAAPHKDDPVTLNLLATIANRIVMASHEATDTEANDHLRRESTEFPVTREQIAEMLRRSLDMDPTRASNFERAGDFYAQTGDDSEAERCYARAFRLDRSRTSAALSLSDIYARSDRPSDALEVLDISLREGFADARVAWQAGVLSSYLQNYEAALTYFKRFAQDVPDHGWMHFYRAQALLALQRADEALEAVESFGKLEPERQFVIKLLRSAAVGLQRNRDATDACLEQFLDDKLSSVDYMATQAIAKLFDLLWNACEWLDQDEPVKQKLLKLLVTSGMTPERYFEAIRLTRAKEEGISFYIVVIGQSLPADWSQSNCCGPGQQDWTQYAMRYGVLSTSQAKAERIALEFQSRSSLAPADLLDVQAFDQEYIDSPGIVWQSIPEPYSS